MRPRKKKKKKKNDSPIEVKNLEFVEVPLRSGEGSVRAEQWQARNKVDPVLVAGGEVG